MKEIKMEQIRDYEKTIEQRIQSIQAKEKQEVSSNAFYSKLRKNCQEMKQLSLSSLSLDELETVLHYWQMMDSLTTKG